MSGPQAVGRPVGGRWPSFLRRSLQPLAAGLLTLWVASAATAAPPAGPQSPCGGMETSPRATAPGAPPRVMSWSGIELAQSGWRPPACTGWSAAPSTLVVALAGSFRLKGGMDALLARLGAISRLRELRYWSTTDKSWRPLALEAAALASADPASRRADFAAAEFVPGRPLHYWMNDSRSGPGVTRLQVRERSAERVVLASENLTPVRAMFVTLFAPGALQTVHFLEQRGPELWQAYLLTRIDEGGSHALGDQRSSAINRLVAWYRRMADIPTDQAPPAAP